MAVTTGSATSINQTGATLSGTYSGLKGNVMTCGFKYGTSAGSLSKSLNATANNGSISAKLSGLAAGTTYYYMVYMTVQGTGDYVGETQTFEGAVRNFTTSSAPQPQTVPTWLSSYEIPANSVTTVSASDVLYNGYYSHSTATEEHGSTKAAIYNTSNSNQRIVVHTFEYNSKVNANYTMLYDGSKRCALWVAYKHNGTEYKDENVGRQGSWSHFDPALPQDWQPDLSSPYSGSTYDRGHQVASNDRQTTTAQNKQTFYYSNITPQYSALNQGQWGTVEGKIQGFATNTRSNQELYVVTGPLFTGTTSYTTDVSGNRCAVPTGYYKCALKLTYDSAGNITASVGCAYIVETNSSNTAATLTTIDYVEAKTGFDFFAGIPDSFENAAEAMNTAF